MNSVPTRMTVTEQAEKQLQYLLHRGPDDELDPLGFDRSFSSIETLCRHLATPFTLSRYTGNGLILLTMYGSRLDLTAAMRQLGQSGTPSRFASAKTRHLLQKIATLSIVMFFPSSVFFILFQ